MQMIKKGLRNHYRSILKNLLPERKRKASIDLASTLITNYFPHFQPKSVLSFYSMVDRGEIDLNLVNSQLAHNNKLVLPLVNQEKNRLDCYRVPDLEPEYLIQSSYGIWEPDPEKCQLISLSEIEMAFIPGLSFEKNPRPTPSNPNALKYYRLGRGKGYYDRLLPKLSPDCLKIGVVYQEQAHPVELPTMSHDQPVDQVLFL